MQELAIKDSLEALVAAFNRGSLDVPPGLFTAHTSFSVNGRAYESILGGRPDDPLIRLLARGAGAYRMAAKALQYALQQPTIEIRSLSAIDDEAGVSIACLEVSGRLRGSTEAFTGTGSIRLRHSGDALVSVEAELAPDDLARIAIARGL